MANATHDTDHTHGKMEIADQSATFSGFLKLTEWGCVLLIMLLGLLVVAFAMGAGWLPGVAVWAVLGGVLGIIMRMGAGWFALVGVSTVLFGIGGLIALLF
jgi:hypothetical protein